MDVDGQCLLGNEQNDIFSRSAVKVMIFVFCNVLFG